MFVKHYETFEKCSISFNIKAREDFNHRNILNISRIEIRTQRRDCADKRRLRKGAFFKGLYSRKATVLLTGSRLVKIFFCIEHGRYSLPYRSSDLAWGFTRNIACGKDPGDIRLLSAVDLYKALPVQVHSVL